jgi:predicted TIM-barrel enzyme
MTITTKGVLPIGVEVDGVLHRDFEIRGATVGDNIDVTEEMAEADEAATPLRIGTAMMARQLVKLGTLLPEQITTELVRTMHTADWNKLDAESSALEKKLLGVEQTPEATGGSTSSPGASSEVLTPGTSSS